MPIVSSIVAEDGAEQGTTGVKFMRFEFTDHLGEVYTHYGYRKYPIATDAETQRAALIPELEASLKRREEKKAYNRDSAAQLQAVLNSEHSTTKDIAKHIIYRLMRERDAQEVIRCKDLLLYIKANYTAAQIRNLLDITNAQLTKMNAKISRILEDVPVGLTYEQILADINANIEVEEWD